LFAGNDERSIANPLMEVIPPERLFMYRIAFAIAVLATTQVATAQEQVLQSTEQKASYAIGHNLANDYTNPDVPFDMNALLAGFRDGLMKKPSLVSDEEADAVLEKFRAIVQANMKKRADMQAAKGVQYLQENAKRPEVKVTKSGLQYEVIKPGTGAQPKPSDTVVCHYKGVMVDGTKFDSSYDRGEPARFPVQRVIPGWTEALQMMKVGGKWKLYIPSDLAYGPQGNRGIPPNSVLIFDIELLDIAK